MNFVQARQAMIESRKKKVSKVKKGNVKTVQYEFLERVSEVTEDDYWKNIIYKASLGSMPAKFSFHDKVLYYEKTRGRSKSNHRNISQVLDSDYNLASRQFIAFIQNHSCVYSSQDVEAASKHKKDAIDFHDKWAEVNKPTRDIMLSKYIKRMSQECGMNALTAKRARNTVMKAYVEGKLRNNDFIIVGCSLVSVADIHWSSNEVVVSKDRPTPKPNSGEPYVAGFSRRNGLLCSKYAHKAMKFDEEVYNKYATAEEK